MIDYVLDKSIHIILNATLETFKMFDNESYEKHMDDATSAICVMFVSMSLELHKQREHMFSIEMLIHLKSVNALEAKTIKYKILMDLFRISLHGVDKVSKNVLKKIELMRGWLRLDRGYPILSQST